ncbi:hypothetical protein POV27_11275 [Aureisphaera galaxeae]|uniref:hypothetical protein n=1 Tax=Aureisphaera galaxeae TaxID=1538023 RepID=UPI002350792B|nr:hypothetical protein [Aureisphaera galaxeae]MDC8004632.1 hypothetical protein [Aureisphaera galaxeae]
MKKLCYFLLFLPALVWGQYDFETRYFKIDATSLPDTSLEPSLDLDFDSTPKFQKSIQDYFKVTVDNYYQPVSMTEAYAQTNEYQNNGISAEELQAQYGNYSGGTAQYGADGATKVKNTVYKEQRGLDFLDPCPPFGVCARCAPYRIGRGF